MRDIKFRVHSAELGRMIKFDDVTEPLEILPAEQGFKFLDTDKAINPVMQYTGLKDKNGVEIYEGDIMTKHPDYYRLSDIVFDPWSASFRFRADEDDESLELTKYFCEHMEIIGNIYENPELLK